MKISEDKEEFEGNFTKAFARHSSFDSPLVVGDGEVDDDWSAVKKKQPSRS